MIRLAELFANNILPIFLASGAGYLLGRRFPLHAQSLSRVAFYLFSPCLLFTSLTQNPLKESEVAAVFGLCAVVTLAVGGVVWVAGRALHLERRMLSAVLISSMFMNSGNFGLPLVDFAFGSQALTYAVLFFVAMILMTNTLGVFIATLGGSNAREAFAGVFKIPALYAVILALVLTHQGWTLPLPVMRTANLLSQATIPTMMVVLGLQIQEVRWSGNLLPMSLAIGGRMLLAPALALVLCTWFGFTGPARQAIVIEAGMPAAVLTTVLATEYNVEPSFVTAVVFVGTLLSPLVLTPLLAFLGA